jgi:hypothetical protein
MDRFAGTIAVSHAETAAKRFQDAGGAAMFARVG